MIYISKRLIQDLYMMKWRRQNRKNYFYKVLISVVFCLYLFLFICEFVECCWSVWDIFLFFVCFFWLFFGLSFFFGSFCCRILLVLLFRMLFVGRWVEIGLAWIVGLLLCLGCFWAVFPACVIIFWCPNADSWFSRI